MNTDATKPEPGSPEAIKQAKFVLNSTGNLELWAALFFPRRMQESAADEVKAEIAKLRREVKNGGGGPRLLKLKAAAAYLNIAPARLRSLTCDGEIAVVRGKKPGSTSPWLWDRADLDNWIATTKERF